MLIVVTGAMVNRKIIALKGTRDMLKMQLHNSSSPNMLRSFFFNYLTMDSPHNILGANTEDSLLDITDTTSDII
jgi:hypothetical protein